LIAIALLAWGFMQMMLEMIASTIFRVFIFFDTLVSWLKERDNKFLSTLGGLSVLLLVAIVAWIFS
jgi:hypothetical protein